MTNETYKIPVMQTDEHETRLRITRRGKRAIGGAAIAAASAAMVTGIGVNLSQQIYEQDHPELSGETVVVVPGDTLSSIADDLDTGQLLGDVTTRLEKANPTINSGHLIPGDTINIPVDVAQWMQDEKADKKP